MTQTVFVLNGPNLNMLGKRQPEIYGHDTLEDVKALCEAVCGRHGAQLRFEQSNAEHQIVDWLHEAREAAAAVVINPAALTHTSVAVRDALSMCECPKFEIHITNVHAREAFRHHSYVSGIVDGVIAGFGIDGYGFALEKALSMLAKTGTKRR